MSVTDFWVPTTRSSAAAEAEMPAAPAAGLEADPALPQARRRLAGVLQATEAADPRLDSFEQTAWELSGERFASRRQRLQQRLHELLAQEWKERHSRRLVKRLKRHQAELFTFLDHPDVPSDNNHAERQIRPAVIVRKNSYANGSEEGAETQAILMSVFRTLKQRGHNPVSAVLDAVRVYLKTRSAAATTGADY